MTTMAGAYHRGIDWLEADYLLRVSGIDMSRLLLEKLQVIEKIQIEAALEKGDKSDVSS